MKQVDNIGTAETMSIPSYTVDRKRWAAMNIFEQMGNIYSEVGRSIIAKQHNKQSDCDYAVIRALDLFDATVDELVKQKSPRTKEILRAKDQYLHAIYDQPTEANSLTGIDRYFMQYAIAARLHR
jgi:hypothetical protein